MAGWNPWRALRARQHITFRLDPIAELGGGGAYYRSGGWAAIVVDPALDRRQRRAVLAHELVHDEHGGGCPTDEMPEQWRVVARRHELRVGSEVARRLVPLDELRALVERMEASGLGGASAHDIAEHFDVPEDVAIVAVRQLGRGGGHGTEGSGEAGG